MNQADRFAFQTDTINRALQHDLVLYGDAPRQPTRLRLALGTRTVRTRVCRPRPSNRLVRGVARQQRRRVGRLPQRRVRPARHGRRRGRVLPPVARIDRARHMAASAQHSRCEPRR